MADSEIDEIPTSNIEVFTSQIPGNARLNLTQDAKYEGLYRQLGDIENLPEAVQKVIAEINTASSIGEKTAIAHSFSLSYIQPEMQYGGALGQERTVSFSDLANDPRGDCDDYAKFNAGILLHAGMNPRDIFIMGGLIEYELEDNAIQLGHAFVIVRDEDQYVLLDNNLQSTETIDPNNPTVHSTFFTNDIDVADLPLDQLETTASIILLSSAVDGRGTNFRSEDAYNILVNNTAGLIEKLESNLPPQSLNQAFNETNEVPPTPNSNPALLDPSTTPQSTQLNFIQ